MEANPGSPGEEKPGSRRYLQSSENDGSGPII